MKSWPWFEAQAKILCRTSEVQKIKMNIRKQYNNNTMITMLQKKVWQSKKKFYINGKYLHVPHLGGYMKVLETDCASRKKRGCGNPHARRSLWTGIEQERNTQRKSLTGRADAGPRTCLLNGFSHRVAYVEPLKCGPGSPGWRRRTAEAARDAATVPRLSQPSLRLDTLRGSPCVLVPGMRALCQN